MSTRTAPIQWHLGRADTPWWRRRHRWLVGLWRNGSLIAVRAGKAWTKHGARNAIARAAARLRKEVGA